MNRCVKPAIEAQKKGIGAFYVDAQQAGEVMPLSGLVKGGLMSSVVRKINGPGSLVKGTFQTQPDTIQFKGWFGKFPHGRTQGWEEEAAREGGQFLILRPSAEGQPEPFPVVLAAFRPSVLNGA